MQLEQFVNHFIKTIQKFDYTLSGFDPLWKVSFKTAKDEWHYLQISRYRETFYVYSILDEELGSLEVVLGKSILSKRSDFHSVARPIESDEESVEDWTKVMIAANQHLDSCAEDWVKVNKQIQEQCPLEYRYGTIASRLVRDSIPDSFRLDKAVGKSESKQFVQLVESGYFFNEQNHIAPSMTVAQYFEYCKIAYLAAASEEDHLDETSSGRAMYERFADNRHEGLLDIDPNSEQEFADWLDDKHPKRNRGGHPWEIKRGGSFTHVGLRVQRPRYSQKTDFKIELYGNSTNRLPETIKMFLAIHQAGLPINIVEPENIRKRLLGQDNFGIVPSYESLYRSNQHFSEEDNVFDTIYYEDLGDHKEHLTPFIRWESLPLLRLSYL
ncbi:MAG: hypothetical protein AAF806_20755 [Bacteroidota bacterium]